MLLGNTIFYVPYIGFWDINVSERPQTKKITKTIRRIPVRETGVSWHYGSPIESSLKALGPSQHYRIRRFKGGL